MPTTCVKCAARLAQPLMWHSPTSAMCRDDNSSRNKPKTLPALPVSDALDDKAHFISRSIEELRSDLEARESLHRDILDSLEAQTRKRELDRDYLDNWGPGYEPSIEGHKAALEKEITDLKKAAVQEDLAFWHDTVALHRELREALEEELMTEAAEGPPPSGLSPPPPPKEGSPRASRPDEQTEGGGRS